MLYAERMRPVVGISPRLTVILAVALTAACAAPTAPTPVLMLTVAQPVVAHVVPAPEGAAPHLVSEFPVTVADPTGPGGTVASVTVVVWNRSRAAEVGRNVRPNKDFVYSDTTLPPRGSLSLAAGGVFSLTPPRDELEVIVLIDLSDGRRVSRTAQLVVAGGSAMAI